MAVPKRKRSLCIKRNRIISNFKKKNINRQNNIAIFTKNIFSL